jgi:hypothetical protein
MELTRRLPIIKKISYPLLIIIAGISILIFLAIRYISPLVFPTPKPKIVRPQPIIYRYYQVIDITTGKTLTYISSAPVNLGDEYITENNKRYVVIRMKGNKAYAKSAGMAK